MKRVSLCLYSRPVIHPIYPALCPERPSFASRVYWLPVFLICLSLANRNHHQKKKEKGEVGWGERDWLIPLAPSLSGHELAFSVFLYWKPQLLSGGLLLQAQLSLWSMVTALSLSFHVERCSPLYHLWAWSVYSVHSCVNSPYIKLSSITPLECASCFL